MFSDPEWCQHTTRCSPEIWWAPWACDARAKKIQHVGIVLLSASLLSKMQRDSLNGKQPFCGVPMTPPLSLPGTISIFTITTSDWIGPQRWVKMHTPVSSHLSQGARISTECTSGVSSQPLPLRRKETPLQIRELGEGVLCTQHVLCTVLDTVSPSNIAGKLTQPEGKGLCQGEVLWTRHGKLAQPTMQFAPDGRPAFSNCVWY